MATTSHAFPDFSWQVCRRWAVGLARAAVGWSVVCLPVLLPLQRLPEGVLGVVLVLLIGAGVGLLIWAADAVRERS